MQWPRIEGFESPKATSGGSRVTPGVGFDERSEKGREAIAHSATRADRPEANPSLSAILRSVGASDGTPDLS